MVTDTVITKIQAFCVYCIFINNPLGILLKSKSVFLLAAQIGSLSLDETQLI